MDQGFYPSGLAPSPAAAERGAARAKPRSGAAEATIDAGRTLHGARAVEQSLSNVQGRMTMPLFLSLLSIPVMWVSDKLPKKWLFQYVKTGLGSVFRATGKALDTPVAQFGQVPSHYLKAVGEEAALSNAPGIEKFATNVAAKISVSGEAAQATISEMAKPLTGTLAEAGEKFSKTRFAQALPGFLKSLPGKMHGATTLQAMIGAGVVAGSAAALVGFGAERKESKQAFKTLTDDLGGMKGAFAQAMQAEYRTKAKSDVAKTGLKLAGQAVWLAPFGQGGAFGAKEIGVGALFAMPDICSTLVPEHPLLGGYMALKQSDTGKLTMDPAQRLDIIRHLVAVMPSVQKHGGVYNRLVAPMATELANRKMNTAELVQFLNDETKFNALATETLNKLQASKSAQGNKPAVAANEAHAAPSAAEAAYHATDKPGLSLVTGAGKAHAGTVQDAALQRQA